MAERKILIIDDEPELRNLLKRLLLLENYDVYLASDAEEGLDILRNNDINVIISDVRLPGKSGLELIPIVRKESCDCEIILLTAYGRLEDGVNSIKAGAFDYIAKGDEDNKIVPVVRRAFEKIELSRRVTQLEKNINISYSFSNISGKSRSIIEAVEVAKKTAESASPVLLIGETGTGKEVFAHAIHHEGRRRHKPFVAVNCSSFSKELLESEMFGYKAGAFTGAVRNKKGLFEEADGGTLFLDEVGELDISLQSKLLRVLENNSFIKQGDTKPTSVDVRIIAATNRDLDRSVETGAFRKDLFFRISVIRILLPPLRERIEDISELADHFIKEFSFIMNKQISSVERSFYDALSKYSFPGNIRELRNIIERIILLSDNNIISAQNMPPEFIKISGQAIRTGSTLYEVEKNHILKVLESTGNKKNEAAEILGIGLTTLYRKLNEYGIKIE